MTGDRYAGETFRQDFQHNGISYHVSELTKSQLYEAFEPMINAEEVELLDIPKMQEQLLGLVIRGTKIDHMPGEHDDWINAAAGAIWRASADISIGPLFVVGQLSSMTDTSWRLTGDDDEVGGIL